MGKSGGSAELLRSTALQRRSSVAGAIAALPAQPTAITQRSKDTR